MFHIIGSVAESLIISHTSVYESSNCGLQCSQRTWGVFLRLGRADEVDLTLYIAQRLCQSRLGEMELCDRLFTSFAAMLNVFRSNTTSKTFTNKHT